MADESHKDRYHHNDVNIPPGDPHQTVYHNIKHPRLGQNTEIQDCKDTKKDRIEGSRNSFGGKIQNLRERKTAEKSGDHRYDHKGYHEMHLFAQRQI